jgi:hypothetical protein
MVIGIKKNWRLRMGICNHCGNKVLSDEDTSECSTCSKHKRLESESVSYCACGKPYHEGYSDSRCDEVFCSEECAEDYHRGDI